MRRSQRVLALLAALALPLALPGGAQAQEGRRGAGGALLEQRVEWLHLPREARLDEAVRLLSETTRVNVVCTLAAAERRLPSLLLQEVRVREAIETVCKLSDLWYREDGSVVRIMTAEEYRKDLVVQREPQTRAFTLLHPNAAAVAGAIRDLYGSRVLLSYGIAAEALGGPLANVGGGGQAGAANPGLASLGGSGAGRFSTTFSGILTAGGTSGAAGRTGGAEDARAERLAEGLTAEQLSRLEVQGGRATGDLAGLTEARPPIAVTVNRRQNVVVVRTGDEAALAAIERLILELDRPTPQVLLEVKVLELDLGDDFRAALDVDLISGPQRANGVATGEPTNPLVSGATTVAENLLAAGNAPFAGGALVYQFLNDHVRVRLEALETEGRLGVLATPLLLCANNEVARIFIGEERPLVRNFQLQSTTTNGVVNNQLVPSVDLRDVGNTLRLVPSINADRTVTLTIVQDVSSVNVGGATLPVPNGAGGVSSFAVDTVSTANLEGTVVAKDGLTLAVGGLIRKEMVDRTSGIPYLMDLPLIGWLFGETVRAESHRELLLLITPHVLTTPAEGHERSRKRLEALSLHPYVDQGDRALQRYGLHDAPGAAEYGRLVEDYLLPWNEPIR